MEKKTHTHHFYTCIIAFLPPVILSLLTYLFYRPSLSYDFQFDDLANISKHFEIRNKTFTDLFFKSSRWIMYWMNTIYFKYVQLNPWLYRTMNVVFHITTGILVYCIVIKLLQRLKKESIFTQHSSLIAYLTSALFLLHPVQTQTVSYVVQGQLEGVATLCIMAIVLCFLLLTEYSNKLIQYTLAILMLLIGFLSTGTKEIAIVSPFITLLVDWFFVSQGTWKEFKKRLPIHSLLFATVWGSYLLLLKPQFFINLIGLKMEARNNIGNLLTEKFTDKITPLHYCMSQFKVILHYIKIFFWPFGICIEYDWKLSKSFFSLDCFAPLVTLMACAYYIFLRLQKNTTDIVSFAVLWFFIFILPRSSIIPSSELMADYKTYGASLGIFLLISAGLISFINWFITTKNTNYNLYKNGIAAACITLCLGYSTFNRNTVWSSSLNLWGNIIECAPGKVRAHNNYGVALASLGKNKEAIHYFKHAINLDKYYPDPINNLAVAYANLKQYDNAIETTKKALQLSPTVPEGYNNLATFYIAKKEYDEAEKCIQKAIQLRPWYGKAYINWTVIHRERGNFEQAFACAYKACTQADFDNEQGFGLYADMSMQAKKYDHAIQAYQKLIALRPSSLNYVLSLAQALALNKNVQEAQTLYQKILDHNKNIVEAQLGLANCLHIMNKDEEAKSIALAVLEQKNIPVALKNTAQKIVAQIS